MRVDEDSFVVVLDIDRAAHINEVFTMIYELSNEAIEEVENDYTRAVLYALQTAAQEAEGMWRDEFPTTEEIEG